MSERVRGPFEALLLKAKEQGVGTLRFRVILAADAESMERWMCWTEEPEWRSAIGRTGEEALRAFVGE